MNDRGTGKQQRAEEDFEHGRESRCAVRPDLELYRERRCSAWPARQTMTVSASGAECHADGGPSAAKGEASGHTLCGRVALRSGGGLPSLAFKPPLLQSQFLENRVLIGLQEDTRCTGGNEVRFRFLEFRNDGIERLRAPIVNVDLSVSCVVPLVVEIDGHCVARIGSTQDASEFQCLSGQLQARCIVGVLCLAQCVLTTPEFLFPLNARSQFGPRKRLAGGTRGSGRSRRSQEGDQKGSGWEIGSSRSHVVLDA